MNNRLYIDVGNTNIVLSYDDKKLLRFDTDKKNDIEYYYNKLKEYTKKNTTQVILSSVVPSITQILKDLFNKYYNIEIFELNINKNIPISINTDHPEQVGHDLIAVSIGALQYKKSNILIVDLGTANKYIYLNNNSIDGVVISPGVMTSLNALFNNAELIPNIEISSTNKVLGTNTIDCVRSGVTYGIAAEVDGLITRIKKELNIDNLFVVATGGLSSTIIPLCYQDITINDTLLIEGLIKFAEVNHDNSYFSK